MQATAVQQARADFIAQQDAAITDYEQQLDRLSNVLLGQGWVIRCAGLTLTFDVDAATRVVSNPRVCPIGKCLRMTEQDARRIAATTKNGAGQTAEAVHVVQALEELIAEARRVRDQVAALD